MKYLIVTRILENYLINFKRNRSIQERTITETYLIAVLAKITQFGSDQSDTPETYRKKWKETENQQLKKLYLSSVAEITDVTDDLERSVGSIVIKLNNRL